ncbi:MAG: hypothetical protein ABW321_13245 [Polyangiales bacterium]
MPQPRVVALDSQHCVAYWHNVAIVDIRGDIDVTRMRGLGDAYRTLRDSHARGIVALVFIRPSVPVADAEARAESARFTRELGDALHTVMVIEERGVLAQMLRSVIRGLNVLSRTTRIAMATDLDDAVQETARHVPLAAARQTIAAELKSAVTSVRAGYTGNQPRHSIV